MKPERYIQRNWRLFCTSLALLLVLTVNHRALPAYALPAPVSSSEKQAVQKAAREDASVVKQKVSLEATPSFTDLDLTEPATFTTFRFNAPVPHSLPVTPSIPYWTFFLQKLTISPISPNAP